MKFYGCVITVDSMRGDALYLERVGEFDIYLTPEIKEAILYESEASAELVCEYIDTITYQGRKVYESCVIPLYTMEPEDFPEGRLVSSSDYKTIYFIGD